MTIPLTDNTSAAPLCGVDLENPDTLPYAIDYSLHPFYVDNFTLDEIEYCATQRDPRLHFTARWCAKEAVKKCLPKLFTVDNRQLEVRKRTTGAPFLVLLSAHGDKPLPVSLSLSHCGQLAIAVVVASATAVDELL